MLHCAISCAPHHSYYDPATLSLDLEGMLADLCAAPSGSVILLHACAHNPTGVSAPAYLLAGGRTGVLAGGRAGVLAAQAQTLFDFCLTVDYGLNIAAYIRHRPNG